MYQRISNFQFDLNLQKYFNFCNEYHVLTAYINFVIVHLGLAFDSSKWSRYPLTYRYMNTFMYEYNDEVHKLTNGNRSAFI